MLKSNLFITFHWLFAIQCGIKIIKNSQKMGVNIIIVHMNYSISSFHKYHINGVQWSIEYRNEAWLDHIFLHASLNE